ncbi:MAG: SipW-dependent-type signal peptide-containing protein [bacterium]|nr:SipW-dependent-type signal peptide-containing protein [bacterium]
MKKILLSLGVIVLVGAVVAGVTGAFYNDTETSSGNIFVAGSIDLKIDHTKQIYNGVDCETCSINLWSSESTQVTGGTGAFVGGYPTNAVALSVIHPNWIEEITGSDAEWIWVTNPVLVADTTNGAQYTFKKSFNWNGGVDGITLDLALAADNGYKIVFNGTTITDQLGTETNFGALVNTDAAEALMLPAVQNGLNTLEITVRNKSGSNNPASNPAGLLFDLTIERPGEECRNDSSFQNQCRLWSEKDLDGNDQFFNFDDIKPGDTGTNVISLHVYDNDAWACLIVHNKDDQENSLLGPEINAGDTAILGNPSGLGELSNYIDIFTWADTNGNGMYENGEIALGGPAPLSSFGSLASLDPSTEKQLTATTTSYIGLSWCAGTMTVNGNDITCDGSGMTNDAQSDSFSASLTAYAEQVRNNTNFSCDAINLDPEVENI